MLKSLLEITKQLLGLAKDTQDNKDNLKAVQTRLETVTDTLKQVIFELQRLKENEAQEREKMGLRLENALLRSERRLIPDGTNEQPRFVELEGQIVALQKEVASLKKRIEQLEK